MAREDTQGKECDQVRQAVAAAELVQGLGYRTQSGKQGRAGNPLEPVVAKLLAASRRVVPTRPLAKTMRPGSLATTVQGTSCGCWLTFQPFHSRLAPGLFVVLQSVKELHKAGSGIMRPCLP